ncbi:Protein YciF [Phycisphaerales bacterium]|nr:Protein YciF [Phycisphaerales bacterium]
MKFKLDSMKSLYIEQLADLLNAERQLEKAMPTLVNAAASEDLREALASHMEETRSHAQRIERIFADLGEQPPSLKCAAMHGLIEEARDILKADGEDAVRDAAIIAAAQRIEHYEIAGYGCARTFAHTLGRESDAEFLRTTLDEEHAADKRLSRLAEEGINQKAAFA